MTEYVMRVARHHSDARDDPNYRMVYSSTNRPLPIVAQDQFTITNSGGARYTIFRHNLGFIPMFLIHRFVEDDTLLELANDDLSTIRMNRRELYTYGGDQSRIVFTIFNINLEEAYDADNSFAGVQATADKEEADAYVMQVPRDRRDIGSSDLRDFTIHTEARSPMVHKVALFDKGAGFITTPMLAVDHGLGYAPIPLVYGTTLADPANTEEWQFHQIGPVSGLGTQFKSNSQQVVVTDTSNAPKRGAVVILTDPILLT